MTLAQFLAHATEALAGVVASPAAFVLLAGPRDALRVELTRPIVGVRPGEDEVLVETADPPAAGPHPGQLTVGQVLARLRALAADYPDRPVEACEPEVDTGAGSRARVDYVVAGTGVNEETGAGLLVCLAPNRG